MSKGNKNNIVIYQGENGEVELRADIEKDTVWATQEQIGQLFNVSSQNITIHLKNIFQSEELDIYSVCKESLHTGKDGKKYLTKFYNLDAIIAIGYRVNSKNATKFRIWATKTLREYIVEGYAINKHRLESSPEKLIGLYDAVAFLESKSRNGKLRGKITLKLTEELEPTEK